MKGMLIIPTIHTEVSPGSRGKSPNFGAIPALIVGGCVVLSDMSRRRLRRIVLAVGSAVAIVTAADASFDTLVAPVLGTSCLQCHNTQMPSGGLDLTPFTAEASLTSLRAEWRKILRRLQAGEMPPKGLSRPAGLDEMIAFLQERLTFRAAAAKVDITPQEPQWLMGYAARQSKGIHDKLHHGVVVLDSGETQFYLVASDLCLFSPPVYGDAARELQKAFGIQPKQFWWSVTHTHSVPDVGPPDFYKMLLGRLRP
jgi:hypothetical protein